MLNIRPENLIGGVVVLLLSLIMMFQAPIVGALTVLMSLAIIASGSKNVSEESTRMIVAGLLVVFLLVWTILGLTNPDTPNIVGPNTDPFFMILLFAATATGCWLVYNRGELSGNQAILMGFAIGLWGINRYVQGSIISSSIYTIIGLLLITGGIWYKSAQR